MTRDLLGFVFTLIATLEPERNALGQILEFMPQSKYRNPRGLSLNRYGRGPFCQFRISARLPYRCVYGVAVDGAITYVGQCEKLSERFNERGYGTVHPRNCFEQGQSTNCKVNHRILESAQKSRRIDLWFHRSEGPARIEEQIIFELRPPWNSQRGGATRKRSAVDPVTESQSDSRVHPSPSPKSLEVTVPIFKLTLEKTYYKQGFFNVTVDFDRFVRPTEGPVELVLGKSGSAITGMINRRANLNGTARIMGRSQLRDWFRAHHRVGDVIDVDLSSLDSIQIG